MLGSGVFAISLLDHLATSYVNQSSGMIQLQHHGVPVLGPQLLHRLLDALHVAGRDVGPGGGRIAVLAFDETVQLIEAE